MNLDQTSAPYVEAVVQYVRQKRIPFHMPGHKQGAGVDPALKAVFGEELFKYDLTEVDGLDYLNAASGVIFEAEALAADAFGARRTFFLINGSTTGNIAAILSCIKENEKILVCRNAHQSTSSGVILSGAVPVYVQPTRHPSGLYPVTSANVIRDLLEKHPDIKAVHLTSPTHIGLLSDVQGIIAAAHDHQLPVILDEAHGAHFVFNNRLPAPGLRLGADFVVQSTHKTLGSFTQTSMLHLGENCPVSAETMEQTLRILQSTSPSTLLVMSLDAARRHMVVRGKELLDRAIDLAGMARHEINAIEGFSCYGEEEVGKNDVAACDPTKLLIDVRRSGYSGYQLETLLGRSYHIEIEMSDRDNILCFVTIGDTMDSIHALVESFRDIHKNAQKMKTPQQADGVAEDILPIPELVLTPRTAFFSKKRPVEFSGSAGHISGEYIVPFPPDIPVVVPGERISTAIIDYIQTLKANNAFIIGPVDQSLNSVQVID